MKKLLIYLCIPIAFTCYSQEYDAELNLPEMPTSAAFVVMGVSPTDIESPQTPADLVFSAQNASEDFTSVPKNYFVNISPYWMFNKKYVSQEAFFNGKSDNLAQNVLQSLQVSLGVSDSFKNEQFDRRVGLGFNTSIIRGNVDQSLKDKYTKLLDNYNKDIGQLVSAKEADDQVMIKINEKISKIGAELSQLNDNDSTTDLKVRKKVLEQSLSDALIERTKRQKELFKEIETTNKEEIEQIKKDLNSIIFNRKGFFFNVAGGFSWDLTDSTSSYYRGGFWLNPGYQADHLNWIGIGRLLSHQELPFQNDEGQLDTANFTTLDAGLKLEYQTERNASLSGEFIYRIVPGTAIEPTYRAVLNLSYNVAKDIKLNLTYGKDFDLFINGKPQNIALVNMVFGLGNTRKLKSGAD